MTRMRIIWRLLQLLGLACLMIVVLTHIAETFHLFPMMGWGQPTSAGHYVDLVSAILGCILLPLGFLGNALMRRKTSKLRHTRKARARWSAREPRTLPVRRAR